MPKPTTKDIANYLGISRGTVSRALNNTGRVSEDTREKVLEAVEKLKYTPNKAARALALNQSYKIAVIHFSEPKYYWSQVEYGVNRAYEELKHFGLEVKTYVTDINNAQEQITLIKELVEKEYDAIAVAPNDPDIMDDAIDFSVNEGVPVLTFNVDVPTSKRMCYVGSNYIKAGRLAGEMMGKLLNGTGNVAMLAFHSRIASIEQRVIGFRETISEFEGIEVVGPFKLMRTGEDAYSSVKELLRLNPHINGIFVSFGILDDVAKAVCDEGRKGEVKIIGYDLSETIARYINQDAIQAVIIHEPFNQGYLAVKLLFKYLNEKIRQHKTIINTKLEIVLKENMEYHTNEYEHYQLLHT